MLKTLAIIAITFTAIHLITGLALIYKDKEAVGTKAIIVLVDLTIIALLSNAYL